MKILFVTPILPRGQSMGGLMFSQAVIDQLRLVGARVRVIGWEEEGRPPPYDDDVVSLGPRAIVTRRHPVSAIGWMARGLTHREPISVAKFRHKRFDALFDREADAADAVFVDHEMTWVLDRFPAGKPIVHISHQIASQIYNGRALIDRRERALLSRGEYRLVARAAQIWTITSQDAETYWHMGARSTRHIRWCPDPIAGGPIRPDLGAVLLGNWAWGPNRRGVDWFVREVIPRLQGNVLLAGRGAERWRGVAGLSVQGVVDDAAALLRRAHVIVIPSTAGVGLQTKTLVAMTTGRPIVATSHAIRDIEERPDSLIVEDEPARFAAAILHRLGEYEIEYADPLANRRAAFQRDIQEGFRLLRCQSS